MTDLNITSENDENNQHVQTVRVGLPIPKGTMPTISLDQSELLSVSYFIRVQIFAQEGIYTTAQGTRSQFMMVDIPFIIGTLATSTSPTTTAVSSPRTSVTSPMITSPRAIASPRAIPLAATSPRPTAAVILPIFSPKINYSAQTSPTPSSRTATPISSPRLVASLLTSSFTAPVIPTTTVSLTPIASPVLDKSSLQNTGSIVEKKSKIMGSIFRKSSSGSSISTDEVKKKRSMFSTLRLYGRNKSKQEEITPTVVMTPKKEEADDITVTNQETATLFSDLHETRKNSDQNSTQKVFKMFDDSDSDEEQVQEPEKTAATGGVFNMFPDSDDDEDEDEDEVTGKEADSVITTTTNQRLDSSHVFKLFDDSSDEEEISQLSISRPDYTIIDERVKPHEQKFEYKPNVKEYVHYKPDSK